MSKVTVRLYRGTPDRCSLERLPSWLRDRQPVDVSGRWFTDKVDIAAWYVTDAPDGVLVAVDVPMSVVVQSCVVNQGQVVQRYSLDKHNEFFLPREWAEKARPVV